MHAVGPRAGCFGREDELARLASLYEDACGRGGRLALLTGPPGAGKTRILGEFKGRMRLAGAVVLEGRCDAVRAFAPVAEIVERALRFLEEVGTAPSGDVGELAVLLGSGGAPRHVDGVPELERRLRFFEAVARLVGDVARLRPPVVLLHDLDRADQGTMDMLAYLLDAGSSIDDWYAGDERTGGAFGAGDLRALFVATVRGEAPSPSMAGLARHARTDTIRVGGLSIDGVRALLSAPEVLQKVLTRTGGIPDAINSLLDSAPPTPEERVRRRLGEMAEGARALAEALAVYGRAATLDEIAMVAGTPADGRLTSVLEASELVHRSLVEGRVLFAFTRESDRERVLKSVDDERRRALHGGALALLERTGPQGTALQEAAHHAMHAGMNRRAVELALDAAPVLAATHAHGEAAALLESVEPIADEDQRAPLSERLVDLLRAMGEYRKAIRRARAATDATPSDAIAARRLGELLVLAGEHGEARNVLDRAADLAPDDQVLLCELDALRAELCYESARYDESERWARTALPRAEASGNAALALLVRNTLGKVALARGEVATAARIFEENRRLAAQAGVRAEHARALTNLGIAMLRRQDMAGAAAAFESALGVAEQIGSTRLVAIARENLAVLAHLRRDYAMALSHYQQAVALLKSLGNRPMLARVANNLGELYVRLGDPARAQALCDFAAQMGGGALPRTVVGEGLLLRARIAAAEGDSASAAASYEAARRLFEEIGETMRVIDACVGLGRLRVDDGDVTGAEEAIAAAGEVDEPKRAAELALLVADVARASGRTGVLPARRALEQAERTDDDELVAPALLRVARVYADQGDVRIALQLVERGTAVSERLRRTVPEPFAASYDRASGRLELEELRTRLSSDSRSVSSVPPPRPTSSAPPPRLAPMDRDRSGQDSLRPESRRPGGLVGRSSAMSRIREVIERVAPSDATVLIRGESGTGKELVAEALHHGSSRRSRPFVKVNCAALVETLLLSELFGHELGAFTGALARRKGRFELADGGTLFLDEIGDISAKTQVALLRVLQEREFERVGGTQKIRVDVRIVAATNRDLEQMVREGTFREDLYYRLRGISIELPPLRDRMDDLGPIAEHILERAASERGEPARRLSPGALAVLSAHQWPGNVRELENVLRSASLFADGDMLEASDFRAVGLHAAPTATAGAPMRALTPEPPPPPAPNAADEDDDDVPAATFADDGLPVETDDVELVFRRVSSGAVSLGDMKREIERECIARALRQTRGNITRAATLLGMKRPRLSQLVKQYGLSGVED
ncbi:MAG: sigma 54-interacting transcriptional regulator [Deltaproteobacteria bacterium]|nr:sigma 54-interacting transcriptional regulator [Deltaproteobacteria bacterium]